MITLAKRENLHAAPPGADDGPGHRGRAPALRHDRARFADRHGGYTRIIKAGQRPATGRPWSFLELVDRPETTTDKDKKDEEERAGAEGEAGHRPAEAPGEGRRRLRLAGAATSRSGRKNASVRRQASSAAGLLYASLFSSLKNAWSTPGKCGSRPACPPS
jgi:hypothetical protein